MRPDTKKEFDQIIDVLTCSDGGVGFCKLRTLLDIMDERAANGDASAAELMKIMTNFSRLVKYAAQ